MNLPCPKVFFILRDMVDTNPEKQRDAQIKIGDSLKSICAKAKVNLEQVLDFSEDSFILFNQVNSAFYCQHRNRHSTPKTLSAITRRPPSKAQMNNLEINVWHSERRSSVTPR
jgi:hypothetical protein